MYLVGADLRVCPQTPANKNQRHTKFTQTNKTKPTGEHIGSPLQKNNVSCRGRPACLPAKPRKQKPTSQKITQTNKTKNTGEHIGSPLQKSI